LPDLPDTPFVGGAAAVYYLMKRRGYDPDRVVPGWQEAERKVIRDYLEEKWRDAAQELFRGHIAGEWELIGLLQGPKGEPLGDPAPVPYIFFATGDVEIGLGGSLYVRHDLYRTTTYCRTSILRASLPGVVDDAPGAAVQGGAAPPVTPPKLDKAARRDAFIEWLETWRDPQSGRSAARKDIFEIFRNREDIKLTHTAMTVLLDEVSTSRPDLRQLTGYRGRNPPRCRRPEGQAGYRVRAGRMASRFAALAAALAASVQQLHRRRPGRVDATASPR